MALVSVTVPDGQRGYALGLLQSVVPASGLLGPLFGGVLAGLIGYRAIFLVVGAVTSTGAIIAAFSLTEVRAAAFTLTEVRMAANPPPRSGVRHNVSIAWQHPVLRQALLAIVASQTLVTMLQPIFVLYVEQLGVEARLLPTITGVLYAATGVTALVAAPWWGRRGDRLGFHGALTIALTGSAAALLLQGLVTGVAQLFVLRLIYGCFVAGILPALFGFISDVAPADRRGGVMGLSSSAAMLGNLLGPLTGGFVAAHYSLRAVFFFSAALMLVTNWYAYGLRRR